MLARWIWIPKCAGTAIHTRLCEYPYSASGHRMLWVLSQHSLVTNQHELPSNWVDAADWTFVFVRNPWDRMVSIWARVTEMKVPFADYIAKAIRRPQRWSKMKKYEPHMGMAMPQELWLRGDDATMVTDDVFRFEDLQKGWQGICERLKMPFKPLGEHNINTKRQRDYRLYYTEHAMRVVGHHEQFVVETFGYQF